MTLLTTPIRNDAGAQIGVIALPLDLAALNRLVLKSVPGDALVTVMDRQQRIVLRSSEQSAWMAKPVSDTLRSSMAGRSAGVGVAADKAGVPRILAFRRLPQSGWSVAAGLPQATVFAAAEAALRNGVVLGLALLAVVLSLTLGLMRAILRPLDALTGEAPPDPVRQVLDSGEVMELANHTVLLARDGARDQIADSAAPIRGGDGTIVGVVLVFSDVTERYRLQQVLVESEARFRALTSLSSDWYWEQDAQFRLVRAEGNVDYWRERIDGNSDGAGYVGLKRWELGETSLSEAQWRQHRCGARSASGVPRFRDAFAQAGRQLSLGVHQRHADLRCARRVQRLAGYRTRHFGPEAGRRAGSCAGVLRCVDRIAQPAPAGRAAQAGAADTRAQPSTGGAAVHRSRQFQDDQRHAGT